MNMEVQTWLSIALHLLSCRCIPESSDLGLLEPLRRSIQFLQYFVHPDGSFGGIYGSKSRFYILLASALSNDIPEAFVSLSLESSIH